MAVSATKHSPDSSIQPIPATGFWSICNGALFNAFMNHGIAGRAAKRKPESRGNDAGAAPGHPGVSGQNHGTSSVVVSAASRFSGKPTRRKSVKR
ncbi:MAG: hypothetical protein Kow0013_23240 [Pararhodobacter sp.]